MTIEERLEEEIQNLLKEMANEKFDSEKYQRMAARLKDLQEALKQESGRNYLTKRAESDDQKADYEYQKLEVEREALEVENEKLKQEKKEHFWDIVKEVVKGVVFVGANVVVGTLLIMANNSGETLPPFAQRIIEGKKLR